MSEEEFWNQCDLCGHTYGDDSAYTYTPIYEIPEMAL